MPGKRAQKVREVGGETRDQVAGTWSNIRQSLGAFKLDVILPEGVSDAIQNGFEVMARAAGRDSQAAGMTSSITLILVGILTSWTGLGIALAILGANLFVYNAIRLIPAVNKYHKKAGRRVGLYKDRDIPLWKRE